MRTEPIHQGSELLRGCTCLWDLDQLIGEEGWDERLLRFTCSDGRAVLCMGRLAKQELRIRFGPDMDPQTLLMIEDVHEG